MAPPLTWDKSFPSAENQSAAGGAAGPELPSRKWRVNRNGGQRSAWGRGGDARGSQPLRWEVGVPTPSGGGGTSSPGKRRKPRAVRGWDSLSLSRMQEVPGGGDERRLDFLYQSEGDLSLKSISYLSVGRCPGWRRWGPGAACGWRVPLGDRPPSSCPRTDKPWSLAGDP